MTPSEPGSVQAGREERKAATTDAPSRRSVRSLLNLGNLGKIKIGGRGTIRHQITIAGPGREGHFTSSVIRRMINWPNGMGSLVYRATGRGQDVAQEIERN